MLSWDNRTLSSHLYGREDTEKREIQGKQNKATNTNPVERSFPSLIANVLM